MRDARQFEQQLAQVNAQKRYALQDSTPVELSAAHIHEGSVVENKIMETDIAPGVSLDKVDSLFAQNVLKNEEELRQVKQIIFDFLMAQMFQYGFYHADPHGGNFHIAREDGKLKIILIDSGAAERVDMEKTGDLFDSIAWLKFNPKGKIPTEYLGPSVFFKKITYLYKDMEGTEMLKIIFGNMDEAGRAKIIARDGTPPLIDLDPPDVAAEYRRQLPYTIFRKWLGGKWIAITSVGVHLRGWTNRTIPEPEAISASL